jgi:hypothetical protein
MSDLDYFSGNSSISMPGSNTSGFDLVGAITNAFSPSSSGSSNWSGANLTQAPTLGFGLGGNDGYSGVQVGNGGFSFGAGLFPNTEVVNVGGATVAGDKIVVQGLRDYASSNSPEDVALIVGGLLAAGLLVSSIGGGAAPSGTVEVSAKKPVEPPPETTTPPPKTTTPPPVVVPPGGTTTPSTDPADPNKEVPKQEPTADEKSLADTLGIPAATLSTLLKYGLPALASYLSYKSAKDAQEQARGVSFSASGPTTATRTTYGGSRYSAAQGGVASLAEGGSVAQPFYLGGITDGMADEVPAHIDNQRPAALSDGEFVVPADVVSHLGNGNSNAGAKRLYEMMDRIRKARTGNSKQGIQVNPNNFMPG